MSLLYDDVSGLVNREIGLLYATLILMVLLFLTFNRERDFNRKLISFYGLYIIDFGIYFCSIVITPVTMVILSFLRYYIYAQIALFGLFRTKVMYDVAKAKNENVRMKQYKSDIRNLCIIFVLLLLYSLYQAFNIFDSIYIW